MQFLTEAECQAWIGQHTHVSASYIRTRYRTPADAGRKTALARVLASLLPSGSDSLMWITGHSVWPSSENLELFYGYRRSLGESRSLSNVPGHLAADGDRASAECIVALALYFSWDVTIALTASRFLLSHDDELIVERTATEPEQAIVGHLAPLLVEVTGS